MFFAYQPMPFLSSTAFDMTMLKGVASAGMKAPDGKLSLNTIVVASGASTALTILKKALRALGTPSGGKMILS